VIRKAYPEFEFLDQFGGEIGPRVDADPRVVEATRLFAECLLRKGYTYPPLPLAEIAEPSALLVPELTDQYLSHHSLESSQVEQIALLQKKEVELFLANKACTDLSEVPSVRNMVQAEIWNELADNPQVQKLAAEYASSSGKG
jgi:hypothetical protein